MSQVHKKTVDLAISEEKRNQMEPNISSKGRNVLKKPGIFISRL